MIDFKAMEMVREPDWITAGIICGVVILVALMSILILRLTGKRKPPQPNPAKVARAAHYASLLAQVRSEKRAEVPAAKVRAERPAAVKSKPEISSEENAAVSAVHAGSKQFLAGAQVGGSIQKSEQGVHMEKTSDVKSEVPAAPPSPIKKPEPAAAPVKAKPAAAEKSDNPFDIFTSSNVEDSPVGKLAAKLNDVDIASLTGEAQDLMKKLKGLRL